jgi:hypothetical protein
MRAASLSASSNVSTSPSFFCATISVDAEKFFRLERIFRLRLFFAAFILQHSFLLFEELSLMESFASGFGAITNPSR